MTEVRRSSPTLSSLTTLSHATPDARWRVVTDACGLAGERRDEGVYRHAFGSRQHDCAAGSWGVAGL